MRAVLELEHSLGHTVISADSSYGDLIAKNRGEGKKKTRTRLWKKDLKSQLLYLWVRGPTLV